jgi:hypothetical protein
MATQDARRDAAHQTAQAQVEQFLANYLSTLPTEALRAELSKREAEQGSMCPACLSGGDEVDEWTVVMCHSCGHERTYCAPCAEEGQIG